MRVAIFEPSSSFCKLLKEAVGRSHEITWVEYKSLCDNASKALQNEQYDAIISSKELEGTCYKTLLNQVKVSNLNAETPILLFSSDNSEAFLDTAFSLGVTDVFNKQDVITMAGTIERMISFREQAMGATILIVEDDKALVRLYQTELAKIGIHTMTADNTECANKILANEHIELVISDLTRVNNAQGQRIIHDIRHNDSVSRAEIPIIAISSSALPRQSSGLFSLGVDDYLTKPVPPLQLSLRVITLIKKYRAQRELHRLMVQFQKRANFDVLTDTYNRNGFLDVAQFVFGRCAREHTPTSILYLDLDNFKQINDNYGREAGDAVLQVCAETVQSVLRYQDILARWGEDEFVVLLQNCEQTPAYETANRIHSALDAKHEALHSIGCSIGVCEGSPQSEEQLLALIEQADNALYRAKQCGKGTTSVFGTN